MESASIHLVILLLMSALFSQHRSQLVSTYDNNAFVCKGSSCVDSNTNFCGKYEHNRTCQCDIHCSVFKDCCYDYVHLCAKDNAEDIFKYSHIDNRHKQSIDRGMAETIFNEHVYTCVVTNRDGISLHQFGAYWMVTVCKEIESKVNLPTKQLISFCQNSSLLQQSLIYSLPVTCISDGITFRNVFCALCNGKSLNDLAPWVVESRLNYDFYNFLNSNPDEDSNSLNNFLDNKTSYQYSPRYFYPVRKCVPQSESVVQACPEYSAEFDKNACRDYLGPGYYLENGQLYRNWHCAICNIGSFTLLSQLPCERPLVLSSSTLLILVQFDGSRTKVSGVGTKITEFKGAPSCGEGYIGDPFTLQCISLICPEMYELRGSTCLRKLEEIKKLDTPKRNKNNVNCTNDEKIKSFQLRPCKMNLTFVTTIRYELTYTKFDSNCIRDFLDSEAHHIIIAGNELKSQYLYSKVEGTFKNATLLTRFVIENVDLPELNSLELKDLTTISITMYYLTVEHIVDEWIDLNSTNINITWYNCASSIGINIVQICDLVLSTTSNFEGEYEACRESFDEDFNFYFIPNLTFGNYFYALAMQKFQYYKNDSRPTCASQRTTICKVSFNETCAMVVYNQSDFVFDNFNFAMTHTNTQTVFSRKSFQLTGDGALYVCSESLNTTSFNTASGFGNENRFLELSQTMIWVNIVGTLSSVAGLLLTIVFRCIIKSMRNLPGKMIVQTSVALIVGQCLVLCEHLARFDTRVCTAFAVLLHYFWLSVFFWQNAFAIEAWHGLGMQKLKMRYAENSYNMCIAYSCYGWGFPVVIIFVCLILHHMLTVQFTYGDVHSNCWIIDNRANLYAFGLPIAIVIFTNFVIFLLIIRSIHKTRAVVQSEAGCNAIIELFQREIIIYIKLSSIMGFTWIFAFLAAFTQNMISVFLFIILNSSQGVFIFLAFNCNKTTCTIVRTNVKSLFCFSSETTDDNMMVSRTRNINLARSVTGTDPNIIKLQPIAKTVPSNMFV
ncbi:uncharacterized protein LOC117106761 [Anneissia japonica]|uniref:uncharacterized protein LOC117106761 n=1 Tax=Anneissia japonica TaxID=1529436 RepID=UPI001425AA3A|nr:uncharacterized protein LOC117106761 [Anneissia japonica]XP_033104078.1 uncharacterized protein LOC117106761 [Anneissia japonica]XP_033104079.1 uncharacterized protein LOC117106761 [Anneissia japonica]